MAVITISGSEMILFQMRGEVITTGVIDSHTVVSHDTTITGAELTQLTGISANVTDTNLNALTAGSGNTSLHSHASSISPQVMSAISFAGVLAAGSGARVAHAYSNTGVFTGSTAGMLIDTGTTSASYSRVHYYVATAVPTLMLGSPTFTTMFRTSDIGTTASMFFGVGEVTVSGSEHTYTVDHIGFKCLLASGTMSLYATQADGTAEEASGVLTTFTVSQLVDLIVVVDGTTGASYYWRINGGTQGTSTLTDNLMDTDASKFQFSISNEDSGTRTSFQFGSASYQR